MAIEYFHEIHCLIFVDECGAGDAIVTTDEQWLIGALWINLLMVFSHHLISCGVRQLCVVGICIDNDCRTVAIITPTLVAWICSANKGAVHSHGYVLDLHQHQHRLIFDSYSLIIRSESNVTCGHDTCSKYYADE